MNNENKNTKLSPQLSIVLPCYNESKSIPQILEEYSKVNKEIILELILVNNGSTDNSREVICEELKKLEYSFARVVEVPKNIGYGHGIQFGLVHCQAPIVGYSHSDLQCSPNDILRAYLLYKNFINKFSYLIKGKRIKRHSLDEKIVTSFYNYLCKWIMGYYLGDINGQPKIFDCSLISELLNGPKDFSFDLYVLYTAVKRNFLIYEFNVTFNNRQFGKSKWAYNCFSRIKSIVNAIIKIFQIRFKK